MTDDNNMFDDHEMQYTGKPLHEREQPLSRDVADAFKQLVDPSSLPVAFTHDAVLECLILTHLTQEDGTIMPITAAARKALRKDWGELLCNSSIFPKGYKKYEEDSLYPIVPVNDFFFKSLLRNGELDDCLKNMSDDDCKHSLPKRSSMVRIDDSVLIEVGYVTGIVVIPPNSDAPLLRRWLQRISSSGNGHIKRVAGSIRHSRPDYTAVQQLDEQVNGIKPAIIKALSKPQEQDDGLR